MKTHQLVIVCITVLLLVIIMASCDYKEVKVKNNVVSCYTFPQVGSTVYYTNNVTFK